MGGRLPREGEHPLCDGGQKCIVKNHFSWNLFGVQLCTDWTNLTGKILGGSHLVPCRLDSHVIWSDMKYWILSKQHNIIRYLD